MILSDAEIEAMLTCTKTAEAGNTRVSACVLVFDDNRDNRRTITLTAPGDKLFKVHLRQSVADPEDYSVVLQVILKVPLILSRFDGPGTADHKNVLEGTTISGKSHRHVTTERYMRARLAPEGFAVAEEFTSLNDAFDKFVAAFNIRFDRPSLFDGAQK